MSSSISVSRKISREEMFLHEQYKTLVNLYKFYLDIALRTSVFFYAITGGILTFYFSQRALLKSPSITIVNNQIDILQFSLILPIIYSVLFGFLSFRGSYLLKRNVQDHIYEICSRIDLLKAPDMGTAIIFFRITALIYFFVAIAMTVIIESTALRFCLFTLNIIAISLAITKWYFWRQRHFN